MVFLCSKQEGKIHQKKPKMSYHSQAVLKTGLCLGPDNGILTWKLVSFFPIILVSLIKEMASLHRSCFSRGYHRDICHHRPLGIYGSLSLSLSKRQKGKGQMKPNPAAGPYSCAKQQCQGLLCQPQVSWWVDTTGCSAMKKHDLVSQSHETTRIHAALVQWHQAGFGGSPSAPSALVQLPEFSSLVAWWLWKIQSPFISRRKSPSDLLQIICHALRITNLFHFKRGHRGSLQARERFSPRKIS